MLFHRRLITGVAFAMAAPLFALAPGTAQASATTLDWTQVSTTGPTPRESAYMAYDSARDKTVLFGGAEPAGTGKFDSDTWEFDGTTWTQIPVSGPPAGALGVMAYDSVRGVSVLFGGGNATTFLPTVTWEWNGSTWSARFTAHAPPARVWTAMSYDSTRHVMVLFGGAGNQGLTFGDTWEYDGTDWQQIVTAHSPPARYGDGLAFDSVRGKTVLFGGHTDMGRVNDTWEYNGIDWTQIAASNPPAVRFWHSMAYEAALGGVVVFGGDYFVPFVTLGPNNETWLYDGTGWHQLQLTDHPSPRALAPMVYDSAHSDLVLFGGSNETSPDTVVGDTWTLGSVGPAPAAGLSAFSIGFGQRPVLSVTTQPVTLTNTGNAPLAITSIAAGGDFGSADNCPRSPATLAAGGACTINVSFTPSTGDGVAITGSLVLNDNAGTGMQSIPLSGSGAWGFLQSSPAPLDLGAAVVNPNGPTATAVETITFPAQATIVTGFSATLPFFVNSLDCPLNTPLSNGAVCHVQVGFEPTALGTYSGQLVIADDEPGFRHGVALSATALAFPPASVTLQVSTNATFGDTLSVEALTNASSGTATFTFNGHQVGGPVDLNTGGAANQVIPLNDSTIPAGAGTYSLTVAVHPTDSRYSDSSATQSVTVAQAPETLSWTGTSLAVAGQPSVLSATVTPPSGETRFYDFSDHPVWVRFDVTDGSGNTSAYYAQVTDVNTPSGYFGQGSATINGPALAAGAYIVRARLVAAPSSATPNAYVTSEDLRAVFAANPVRGGYIAGAGQQNGASVAFEFSPGSTTIGALFWVQATTVTGSDGQQHDAYAIISSTAVTSIVSHSHTASTTGTVSIIVVDATTGARYPSFDQTTTFQLTINPDSSVVVATNGYSASLPAGSGINHL